jgi:hypothetical protein
MTLDPRLEADPEIITLRLFQEEQRAEAEFKVAWDRDDIGAARRAADRITALDAQIMARVWQTVGPFTDCRIPERR